VLHLSPHPPAFILVFYACNLGLYKINQVISLWKVFVWCQNFLFLTIIQINFTQQLLYIATCDLNWRGKLRNAVVYVQFYLVTTLLELSWISALWEHRFPWKTVRSWENYLLTTLLLLEPGDSNPHPHNRFIWFILILSFSLHVMFLSCSLKKSCVRFLLVVCACIDGSVLCTFFRFTQS
jgi:hypothetical protein